MSPETARPGVTAPSAEHPPAHTGRAGLSTRPPRLPGRPAASREPPEVAPDRGRPRSPRRRRPGPAHTRLAVRAARAGVPASTGTTPVREAKAGPVGCWQSAGSNDHRPRPVPGLLLDSRLHVARRSMAGEHRPANPAGHRVHVRRTVL